LELDCLQLQFVLKWPLLFPSVAVQVTVFGPFTNLLVNVLLLPLYNYRKRLERLIENCRYKLPSLHLHYSCKVAIVELDCPLQLQFVLKWPYCYCHQLRSRLLCLVLSLNLLVNVLHTVVQLSEALGAVIENCHRYKLPSLHLH
jgi:hypothetical protein